MIKAKLLYGDITDQIIADSHTVHNALGSGFMEKVYENALVLELRLRGLTVDQQHPIKVWYRGEAVGEYFADLLVEGKIIVELKAQKEITDASQTQLLNYLRATDLQVGLVINFGDRVTVKRRSHYRTRRSEEI